MRAPKRALGLLAIAVVLALAFFVVPGVTDSGHKASAEWPYTLIYYDGHMHTTRSDGNGSVADIKATAQGRGLSAVIITDHCKDLTRAEWASLKTETAAVSDSTFLALPAFEITGSEGMLNRGHMNAYNVSSPFVTDELCPEEVWLDPPNPAGTGANAASLTQWADWVHSKGGIVNHNHTSGSTQLSYGVDNIEVYNQGHVDDIMSYAVMLGLPSSLAWQLAITINNFALYGERDVNISVPFPGIDDDGDQWEDGTRGLPYFQCFDTLDNDGDTLKDSADPQCLLVGPGIDEDPPGPAPAETCPANGVDDDNDGVVDDGCDNDGDGKVDEDGPTWMPLRNALYLATQLLTGVGQWLGSPQAPLHSWDEFLMAYVNGEVSKPTFAVANSDAHNTGDPDSKVGVAKNGLYVLALTPTQVYSAIRAGRGFATTGPSLAVDVNGTLMGGTAYVPKGGSANLNLSANSESPTAILVKIDVIKNGTVVDTFSPMSPTYLKTLTYPMTERGYYRVEVTSLDMATGAYQFAYSNPVFVKCPFDKDCDGYLDLVEKLLGSNPDDATSTPENILIRGTCKDGLDNDGDGLIDTADRGCPWPG